jgi:hypothetical protein
MDPISIQADIFDRTAAIDSPIDPIESLVEAQLQAEINTILYNIPKVFNICYSYVQYMLTIQLFQSLTEIPLQLQTHSFTEIFLIIPQRLAPTPTIPRTALRTIL